MVALAWLAQADPELVQLLDRIAAAQLFMAVAMGLLTFMAIVGALMSYRTLRAVGRMLRSLEHLVGAVNPRATPLLDKAGTILDDLAAMTQASQRRLDDVLYTIEDLRRGLERGGTAVEARVQRFALVLDMVQEEAEDMLIEAAATARGVHTTTRALRSRRPRAGTSRPPVRMDEDRQQEVTDEGPG